MRRTILILGIAVLLLLGPALRPAVAGEGESIKVDKFPTMITATDPALRAPEYPEAAKKDGIEGTVMITLTVEKDGTASGVRVIQGVRADLDQSALTFIKRTRFTPAEANGQPVAITVTVPVRFKLDSKK